jgi:cell division protein FtsB
VRTTLLAPLALVAAGVIAVADGDAGIPTWLRLRGDVERAEKRVQTLVSSTAALRGEIEALRQDPFALERAIREDLELARPGEIIIRFDRPGRIDW